MIFDFKRIDLLKNGGFTLLELLTVVALVAILSFSVVYSLQGEPKQSFRESQKLVEKLLQTARTTAILKNQECRLMVLHDPDGREDGRLMTLAVREHLGQWRGTSTFVMLPEGIEVTFDQSGKVSLDEEIGVKKCLWNFVEFDRVGTCSSRLYLKSKEGNSMKMTFTITKGGAIEID